MRLQGKRKEVIIEARTWLGTSFGPGAVKGVSTSCVGFIVETLANVGLFDSADAVRPFLGFIAPMTRFAMIDELNKHFKNRTPYGQQLPGDLMLFHFGDGPKHLAFVSEYGNIIHAHASYRKVVEHLRPKLWRPIMIYRLPGE